MQINKAKEVLARMCRERESIAMSPKGAGKHQARMMKEIDALYIGILSIDEVQKEATDEAEN